MQVHPFQGICMRHERAADPRVVVITGASSGIGRATAHAFAREGVCLVLAARQAAELEQAARECLSLGARGALAVPTDVTDDHAVAALAARAVEAWGRIDVWGKHSASRARLRPMRIAHDETTSLEHVLMLRQTGAPHASGCERPMQGRVSRIALALGLRSASSQRRCRVPGAPDRRFAQPGANASSTSRHALVALRARTVRARTPQRVRHPKRSVVARPWSAASLAVNMISGPACGPASVLLCNMAPGSWGWSLPPSLMEK